MEPDAFDRTEVQRAKYTIYLNSACCAGWCAINAFGAWLLGAVHLWGLFAASAGMIASWTFALRDLRHGFVLRGVLNYVVSGLLLLLAMSLSVPEMSLLFVFATFIFLAFGLSYADRAASLWIVALTLVVAAIMLVTSLGLQWKSGVDPHLIRWVNLVGMTMALSIDAIQFIALRETLQARGEVKARAAARLEIVSNTAHEFASASGDIEALLELVARRITVAIGDSCVVRLISDDRNWLESSASDTVGNDRVRVGEGVAGTVAATGEPVLTASELVIPLRSRGRTTGVLTMLRGATGEPYTLDDQRLAQDLADRAGLAIDNAMLVATLEQRVRERTAELELANRELEAFSYSVSHDLRSPLRAIDGFSHALADEYAGLFDEAGHRYLSRIRAGTQRMGTLMDGLLALARIGRAPLKITSVDVTRIAEEIAAELRHRDPERAVAVTIASGLVVRADARLVAIAFENLLGNAWKFTAKAPNAEIEVGARGDALFVRDNGAGFDMAHATKLYAPFQRLHGASEFAGDGIGLATVSRIVSHHRGRISAESAVGSGATFYVTFGDDQRAPA